MKDRIGLRALRPWWWVAALGVVVGLAAAQWVIASSTPLYRSTTQLFIGAAGTSDGASAAYNGGLFAQQRVASYTALVQSERLADEVIADLQLSVTPAQLAGEVTATALPNTVILQVSVTDTSPRRAQAIAEAWGRHVITDVTAVEQPDASVPSAVKVSTIQAATYEPTPVSPNTTRDRALGALLGLLGGLALVALASRRRSGIRAVEAAVGAPVLAAVVRDDQSADRPIADVLDPRAAGPEELRVLRTRIYPPGGPRGPAVVVVTSADRGEGAATVAAQFAAAVVRGDRTALLIDADLEHPWLSQELGCADSEGLADVLAGTADQTAVIHDAGTGGPAFLPAGRTVAAGGDGGGLLAAPKIRALLDTLCTAYDTVVISAPPVLAGVGAGTIGALGDGTILVVRHGSGRRNRLTEAATTLSWYGVTLVGAVLTSVPQRESRSRRRSRRYSPDPYRAGSATAGSSPGIPFGSAAPDREEGRLFPMTSPAGADPS